MITVMIATTGRPDSIRKTLESIVHAKKPSGLWFISVIVNGGDKASLNAVEFYLSKLPLTIHFTKDFGKNRALNKIVSSVKQGLVVFADDDVAVESNWLCAWEKKASENDPISIYAGKISIELDSYTENRVKDLGLSRSFMFAETSFTKEELGAAELCWGGNYAVHSNVFNLGHRFSEFFGPNGQWNYPMGSEVEFCIRLEKAGYKVIFFPEPAVKHFVRKEQLSLHYIFKRHFRAGRSSFFMRLSNLEKINFPLNLVSALFFLSTRIVRRRFWIDPIYQTQSICQGGFLSGQFYQFLRGDETSQK